MIDNTGILLRYIYNAQLLNEQELNKIWYRVEPIKGWLTPTQFAILYSIGLCATGKIVEIGAYKGKSICVWCLATIPTLTSIYAVDLFKLDEEGYFLGEFKSNLVRFGFSSRVMIQEGDSSDICMLHQDNSIDLLYIDADHTFQGVEKDILNWTPKLKSGGLIVGHDYPHPQDPNGGFEGLRDAVNKYVRDNTDIFLHFGFYVGLWAAQKK